MKNKIFMPVLLAFALLANQGCVALLVGAAAGAGGIAYVKGNLEQNFDFPVEKMHTASLAALKKLGMFVTADELARHDSKIKAEGEKNEKIEIDIVALTEKSSKISIRVGVFGDQEKSRMILNAIQKKL